MAIVQTDFRLPIAVKAFTNINDPEFLLTEDGFDARAGNGSGSVTLTYNYGDISPSAKLLGLRITSRFIQQANGGDQGFGVDNLGFLGTLSDYEFYFTSTVTVSTVATKEASFIVSQSGSILEPYIPRYNNIGAALPVDQRTHFPAYYVNFIGRDLRVSDVSTLDIEFLTDATNATSLFLKLLKTSLIIEQSVAQFKNYNL